MAVFEWAMKTASEQAVLATTVAASGLTIDPALARKLRREQRHCRRPASEAQLAEVHVEHMTATGVDERA